MHYFIGRDIDGDGYPEFIEDLNSMILTDNPARALQFTANELAYIDMPYLNSLGFFAIEAHHYGIPMLAQMLFRPTVRGYRPRVAPPPRRPRPAGYRGPMRGPVPMHGPMGNPVGGPVPRPGYGPAPSRGPMGGPMGGPGPMGGRGPGGRGPGGRGPMGGPIGGRGPGR